MKITHEGRLQVNFSLGQVEMEAWRWVSEISLRSLVTDNVQSTQKQDEQTNDLKTRNHGFISYLNDIVDKASTISVGATENQNALVHWATGFQFFFLPCFLLLRRARFTANYIRDPSGVFSTSSLVWWRHLKLFSQMFVQTASLPHKKIIRRCKDMNYSLSC